MFGDVDAFEYLAAVEVPEGARVADDFTVVRLPAQDYAKFRRLGDADPRDTIYTIWHEWLPTSGYRAAGDPRFLYVYGEDYDLETERGELEVWVPVIDGRTTR